MLELKDYLDRGLQVGVSPDGHYLTLSGPDGVIRLTSFSVAGLAGLLKAALPGMVSVPVLSSESIAAPEAEAVFTPGNPRPEETPNG